MGRSGEVVGGTGLRVDLIRAESGLGEKAVAHGIGKSPDVSGGGEHGLVGEDGSIESENVVAFLDVLSPPVVLEVTFEFRSEWAVVPATIQPAVEFGRLKDESTSLAQGDNFLHAYGIGLVFVSHGSGRSFFRGARGNRKIPWGERFFRSGKREVRVKKLRFRENWGISQVDGSSSR